MIKVCPICGKECEGHGKRKYCSGGCYRESARIRARERYRAEKDGLGESPRKNNVGWVRISKSAVKAPSSCFGQTTCLECTRKRCKHG